MNGDIALIDILSNNATVAPLLGGSGIGVARVFPGEVPQGTVYPCVTVDVFDATPFDTKTGPSSTDHELVKAIAYASNMLDLVPLANAIRDACDGVSGTYGGHEVEYIRFLKADSYNIPYTNRKVFVRELDFEVRIRR